MLAGTWDIVGGHLEAGETPEEALARELEEETGWRLRRIEAVISDWECHDGVPFVLYAVEPPGLRAFRTGCS